MGSTRRLDGDVALITGASRGIGAETARTLARAGADVALLARSEDDLDAVADGIDSRHDVNTLVLPGDVRDSAAVEAAVEATVEKLGRLDVLVNNAGITGAGYEERLEDPAIENFERVTEVNVFGTFYATRAALPHLRERNGTLVFVGSSAAKVPRPGAPVYAASKWWMRGFARSVEARVGQDGIAVSLVNPTAVRTRLWDDLEKGEAAEPEEVAELVTLAASQPPHSTLSEVDLFRRDMLGTFIPRNIDLDVPFDVSDDATRKDQ